MGRRIDLRSVQPLYFHFRCTEIYEKSGIDTCRFQIVDHLRLMLREQGPDCLKFDDEPGVDHDVGDVSPMVSPLNLTFKGTCEVA